MNSALDLVVGERRMEEPAPIMLEVESSSFMADYQYQYRSLDVRRGGETGEDWRIVIVGKRLYANSWRKRVR